MTRPTDERPQVERSGFLNDPETAWAGPFCEAERPEGRCDRFPGLKIDGHIYCARCVNEGRRAS